MIYKRKGNNKNASICPVTHISTHAISQIFRTDCHYFSSGFSNFSQIQWRWWSLIPKLNQSEHKITSFVIKLCRNFFELPYHCFIQFHECEILHPTYSTFTAVVRNVCAEIRMIQQQKQNWNVMRKYWKIMRR